MIIAFSGAHGTGKTTAAYQMAADLKRTTCGEVGLILEVARQCPFPVLTKHRGTTFKAQFWVFTEQIRRELEYSARYDCVVADRTIVDAIAYTSMAGYHGLAAAQLAIAREHAHTYDRVIFHGSGDFSYLVDDDFRVKPFRNFGDTQCIHRSRKAFLAILDNSNQAIPYFR